MTIHTRGDEMTFTNEQICALSAKLDAAHVRERAQAGRKLAYIEGWHVIAEANRIFGFDGWDRQLVALQQLGEPREVDGKSRVAYRATVRIIVRASGQDIIRDGTGYGSGIDKDLGQAHESALKEAETDAMKRALMTFGNPFGLALYDKEQSNVERAEPPRQQRLQRPPHDPQTGEIVERQPPPANVTSIEAGAAAALKAEIADELAMVSELDAMEPLVQRFKVRINLTRTTNPAVYGEIRAMLSSRKAALMADPATALRA